MTVRPGRWLAASLLMVLTSACGVPLQSTADPVPANVLPPAPTAASSAPPSPSAQSPAASPSASPSTSARPTEARLRLWFVQDDGLAAAESALIAGSGPDLVVQALAVGPDPEQVASGLRTIARDPLSGLSLVSIPAEAVDEPDPATAVNVRLDPAFSALPSSEQVLLLGQVVLSLTGSGWGAVSFTDQGGVPVAVPLPDGLLLDSPAIARDYASLIIRP